MPKSIASSSSPSVSSSPTIAAVWSKPTNSSFVGEPIARNGFTVCREEQESRIRLQAAAERIGELKIVALLQFRHKRPEVRFAAELVDRSEYRG